MATFTVTTNRDVVNAGDGVLSLREALNAANATTAADTIVFDLAADKRTITLAGSQLTASADVTIDGGSGVTIDADEKSRVLLVRGAGSDVALGHLTITGGETRVGGAYEGGGGISAAPSTYLSLRHCNVTDNAADGRGGGIASASEVRLDHCKIADNHLTGYYGDGHGVYARSIIITATEISDNGPDGFVKYGRGGGIHGQYVKIDSSTVVGNNPGGSYYGFGGGVFSLKTLEVVNSTIIDNEVNSYDPRGGGIRSQGTATLINTTVTGNISYGYDFHSSGRGPAGDGGGISGRVNLENCVVAGNTARVSNPDVSIVVSSNGHNIFGSDVNGNASGDLENAAPALLFATLDPVTGGGQLADNGGPTQTVALRNALDNPALAGADPADGPATDQRGVARPQPAGTDPDIGAFELRQSSGQLHEITGTPGDDFLSGTARADLMRGLGGDDRLWGRAGDDVLFGNAGRDVLAGKAGIDEMSGGKGADRFLFRQPSDAPVAGPGHDAILDFSRAQADRIDVKPIDANWTADGNQAFHFIGQQPFTQPGQLHYEVLAPGEFLVSGSTDRDLAPEFAFLVDADVAGLHASDFLL